jgi:hypothetical protein
MGLRDQFLQRATKRELVPFDAGLESPVFIRPMRKGTKSRVESLCAGKQTAKDCSEVRWITLRDCLCDGDGESLLTADDRSLFDSWDESFIEPIFSEAFRVSGITDKEREELEADEKN